MDFNCKNCSSKSPRLVCTPCYDTYSLEDKIDLYCDNVLSNKRHDYEINDDDDSEVYLRLDPADNVYLSNMDVVRMEDLGIRTAYIDITSECVEICVYIR